MKTRKKIKNNSPMAYCLMKQEEVKKAPHIIKKVILYLDFLLLTPKPPVAPFEEYLKRKGY